MVKFLPSPQSIVFIHDYIPYTNGDGGGLVVNTAHMARMFALNGWQATIATPEIRHYHTLKNGVLLKPLSSFNEADEIIKSHDVILLNLNYSLRPAAIAAAMACIKQGKEYFVRVGTTLSYFDHCRFSAVSSLEKETILAHLQNYLNHDLCKKVICVSDAVKEDLVTVGVRDLKLLTVLNGVMIYPDMLARPDHSVGDVIYVGRLSEEKGLDCLIAAMREITDWHPSVSLSFIGNGPEREKLSDLVQKLDLTENVKFWGKIEHKTAIQIMKQHKLLCLPSNTEGCSNTLLEALVYGIPVVVSSIDSIKEIICVNNRMYGYLFEPQNRHQLAQRIIDVLENYQTAMNIAIHAQRYAIQRFSLERQFIDYLKVVHYSSKLNHFRNAILNTITPKALLKVR